MKLERTGVALLHAMLRRRPLIAPLAPVRLQYNFFFDFHLYYFCSSLHVFFFQKKKVLLQYLLGTLPSSVRDLLRAMNTFDSARARHYRHIRLVNLTTLSVPI